jgi:hypothetical protein
METNTRVDLDFPRLSECDELMAFGPLVIPEAGGVRAWSGRVVVRSVVAGGGVGLLLAVGFAIALPMIRTAHRERCRGTLGQIGVAMHNYHEIYGSFPAPASRTRNGSPLLSWRVAILPQLGYQTLYDRFHLDEPWDSPHNLSLVGELPRVYNCPSGAWGRTGRTGYQVIVGPKSELGSINTPFQPGRGVDIREIMDGSSNTILVAETDILVPWTKPDDLRFVENGRPPRLASAHGKGYHVLLADGSTRFINSTIQPRSLLALFTINGGEVISA